MVKAEEIEVVGGDMAQLCLAFDIGCVFEAGGQEGAINAEASGKVDKGFAAEKAGFILGG